MGIDNDRKTELLKAIRPLRPSIESEDLTDYLYELGNARWALLYSTLFMPDVVEIADSVFLAEAISDEDIKSRLLNMIDANAQPIEDIEAAFNLVELGYEFLPHQNNLKDDELVLLAHRLREAWDGWLRLQYPPRIFNVRILMSEVAGESVGLTFSEVRSAELKSSKASAAPRDLL